MAKKVGTAAGLVSYSSDFPVQAIKNVAGIARGEKPDKKLVIQSLQTIQLYACGQLIGEADEYVEPEIPTTRAQQRAQESGEEPVRHHFGSADPTHDDILNTLVAHAEVVSGESHKVTASFPRINWGKVAQWALSELVNYLASSAMIG